MAKVKNSMTPLSGTLYNVTYVRTRLGDYARAPRGTYKPAPVNDKFKTEQSRNTIVAKPAQLVLAEVKEHAKAFMKGDLWQDMLSRIRKCKTNDFAQLLQTLEGLEVNPRYPLRRSLPNARMQVQYTQGVMTLALHTPYQPSFKMPKPPADYCCDIRVVFADDECNLADVATINTGWLPVNGPRMPFETTFETPVTAMYYVVLVEIHGGTNGEVCGDKRTRGMAVMKTGRVE